MKFTNIQAESQILTNLNEIVPKKRLSLSLKRMNTSELVVEDGPKHVKVTIFWSTLLCD